MDDERDARGSGPAPAAATRVRGPLFRIARPRKPGGRPTVGDFLQGLLLGALILVIVPRFGGLLLGILVGLMLLPFGVELDPNPVVIAIVMTVLTAAPFFLAVRAAALAHRPGRVIGLAVVMFVAAWFVLREWSMAIDWAWMSPWATPPPAFPTGAGTPAIAPSPK